MRVKPTIRIFITVLVIAIGCVFWVWWFFQRNIMYTADTMSLTYSRSVSSFPSSDGQFYVKDNTLYFIKDSGDSSVIRYVKNNRIRTFSKFSKRSERFIVLDDKSAIVQAEGLLWLLKDGDLVELWQGKCAGCYGDLVYFTNGTTLYAAELGKREPQAVASFDELLASYHNGIVYKNSDGIYELLFEKINEPQLLTSGDIEWSKDKSHWLVGYKYLYTPDYALRIGSYTLDMYIYKTGEMRRIYEVDRDNMVLMSVTAKENELYVSRQYVDFKLWEVENEEITGTYKYDVEEDVWKKIADKWYHTIDRFDEQYLYGMGTNSVGDVIESIGID